MPTTYRFMSLVTPTTIKDMANHIAEDASEISITTPPPTMLDVTIDDPSAETQQNLTEYLDSLGYIFMETDPAPMQDGETLVWENGQWVCIKTTPEASDPVEAYQTTKASEKDHVSKTFTSDGGKYMVMYQATISCTSSNGIAEAMLIADNDAQNPLASYTGKPGGSDKFVQFTGFVVPAVYSQGPHTIKITFRRKSGSGTAKIENARINVWRVV